MSALKCSSLLPWRLIPAEIPYSIVIIAMDGILLGANKAGTTGGQEKQGHGGDEASAIPLLHGPNVIADALLPPDTSWCKLSASHR
jgi:hypothetical protein